MRCKHGIDIDSPCGMCLGLVTRSNQTRGSYNPVSKSRSLDRPEMLPSEHVAWQAESSFYKSRSYKKFKKSQKPKEEQKEQVDIIPDTKLCKLCCQEKPKESFGNHYRSSDGLQGLCNDCNALINLPIPTVMPECEAEKRNSIEIDFTDYPDLYANLVRCSCKHMKPIVNQILRLIKEGLDRENLMAGSGFPIR